MCHKSMAHPHIYFSLRLNIFSLKAKYIFFQACKSGGTSAIATSLGVTSCM